MGLFPILLSLPCVVFAQSGDAQLVPAIKTAYDANRAALSFGKLRFEYAQGHAPDAESARKGEWSPKTSTNGSYIYDGPKGVFDMVFSGEQMLRNSNRLRSSRVLTNGRLTLWDLISLDTAGKEEVHTSQIEGGNEAFFHYVLCPLDLGNPSPQAFDMGHNLAKAFKPGDWVVVITTQDDKVDGIQMVHLVMTDRDGFQRHYWVDLERGAIPRLMRDVPKEGPGMRICYDDLRLVGNKAWLPFRMTIYFDDGGTKQSTILEAEFEKRPSPSEFRLEFVKPESEINTAAMVQYKPQKSWDLDRLPPPGSQGARHITLVEPWQSAPPEMPTQRRSTWNWAIVVSTFVALIAVVAVGVRAVRRSSHGFRKPTDAGW